MMIPDEITAPIVPEIPHLWCKLYKLNIYGASDDHFKAHIDTPRSEQMFGSLVVCLPTCFSGGALVTRHHQQEVKCDWSSSFESPMQELCQAIKPHSHDLEGMQTAVKAILYHSVDNKNREEQHQYCQKGRKVGAISEGQDKSDRHLQLQVNVAVIAKCHFLDQLT